MIDRRLSADRGHASHGWLDSYHSFSFANYYDPDNMGFSSLRVINQDTVAAGQGFGMHGHRDMAIISYVLEGEVAHRDSMGNGSTIRPGDVQLMNAGTGVMHSEFNPSTTNPVHFLQIWIMPKFNGTPPDYKEARFTDEQKRGRLCVVASPDGRNGSLVIGQDAVVMAALLDGNETASHTLAAGRNAYLHVARGSLTLNGQTFNAGDGAKISNETTLQFSDGDNAEFLLFDLD